MREEGLFTKSSDKDIYDSLSAPLPLILLIQHNLTCQMHKFDTFFILNGIKTNMQACLAKYMGNSL